MSPARISVSAPRLGWCVFVLLLLSLGLSQHRADASQFAEALDQPCTTCPGLRPAPSSPGLLAQSITWTTTDNAPIVPGRPWSGTYAVRPIWSYQYEFVDSFFLDGPFDWTVASITPAPEENTGDGLKFGQAFQNPGIGLNISARAHVYWGFDPLRAPMNYVNGPVISPPTRSNEDNKTGKGVYLAAPYPGGPERLFGITYNVPESWSKYLCPGAAAPHEYVGLSGNSADPNFLQATLYSSGSDPGTMDALFPILLPCRQPQVSATMTSTLQNVTGSAGGAGTMTVGYCITTSNTSPEVSLSRYTVSSESIGYSETREVSLAPKASDTVCTRGYTYDIVWPTDGSGCVINASGSTVAAETPGGWGERTPGQPENGFTQRTFSASASAGIGLETCATPLSVELAWLTAVQRTEGVEIGWETVSEHDNLGFNLYRADGSSSEQPEPQSALWKRLNRALIPARQPGSPGGHTYTWFDETAATGRQWYLLEDVDLAGRSTRHGPAEAVTGAPNAVGLARLAASTRTGTLAPGVAVALSLIFTLLVPGIRKRVLFVTSRTCNVRQK
jgi:hypothetical protein